MKLKFLYSALIAAMSLSLAVSCDDPNDEASLLSEVKVSNSYVALPTTGETCTATFEVNAKSAWRASVSADWLTVSPMEGAAGKQTVTLSASASEGRTAEVAITADGETQIINVIQGLTVVNSVSCAECLAGPDSKTYQIKGTCTKIVNTQYGNWYINDGTGEVYIYGTLDKNGGEKNFLSLGIEEGDIVTVQGPKTTYNGTVELVNVTVVKIEKSLIKLAEVTTTEFGKEGGDAVATFEVKGEGIGFTVEEAAQSWLHVSKIAGNDVTVHADANAGGARAGEITFTTRDAKGKEYTAKVAFTQEGSIVAVTAAQFNALADDANALYTVHGVITSIVNDTYGNLYINDGTGEVYVYGVLDAAGAAKNFASLGLKVGDEVVLQSIKTSYKDAPQMKNAVVNEVVAHDTKTCAELNELDDDKNTYYYVSGEVFQLEGDAYKFDLTTYGNFGIKDATGQIYVYGVSDALDGVTKNFAATGVKQGDTITILAYKTSYKGNNQVVGKFIKNTPAAAQ